MENEIYNPEDELTHWGIPGMKWGQRRYQNKDGTLTPAGKKRYNAELAKVRKEEAVVKNRQAVKARMDRLEARKKAVADKAKELDDAEGVKSKASKIKKGNSESNSSKKSYKDMTDAELKAAIDRAKLEDDYRKYNPAPAPKQSFGKRFLSEAVTPALLSAGKDAIEKVIKKNVEDILKDKTAKEKLSWDDMIKKQTWEKNERDRKKEEAEAAKKQAEEAKKRAEANRKANDERSRQEYEKTYYDTQNARYRNTHDTTYAYSKKSTSDTVNTGKTTIAGLLTSSGIKPTSSFPAPTVNKGERAAVDVLDTSGSVIAKFDRNGNLID